MYRRRSNRFENQKRTFWIYYEIPRTYRGDRIHWRTESKKVEVSEDAFDVRWDRNLKVRTNKQGNKKYGVELIYKKEVGTKGGGKTVKEFSRIVSVPDETKNLVITQKPPEYYSKYPEGMH